MLVTYPGCTQPITQCQLGLAPTPPPPPPHDAERISGEHDGIEWKKTLRMATICPEYIEYLGNPETGSTHKLGVGPNDKMIRAS